MYIRGPFDVRYWAHVQKSDGCWEWIGPKDSKGYGLITRDGKSRRATREAWRLATGDAAPANLQVCHSCDNPSCVNPAHLFLGTNAENSADRDRKGRWRGPASERHGSAVLTNEKVLEMRKVRAETGAPFSEIARQFGVSKCTVVNAVNGRTWRNV